MITAQSADWPDTKAKLLEQIEAGRDLLERTQDATMAAEQRGAIRALRKFIDTVEAKAKPSEPTPGYN
jgi:hypothetical protein